VGRIFKAVFAEALLEIFDFIIAESAFVFA